MIQQAVDIREVGTPQAFDGLRASWNELVHRLELPSPFHSWEWNRTWWEHFGNGRRLRILLFTRANRLLGIAQFYERRIAIGAGPRMLIPLGWEDDVRKQGLTEQWELLFPTEHRGLLMDRLAAWLTGADWSVAVLPSLPTDASLGGPLSGYVAAVGQPVSSLYRALPSSWETFERELNKSMRDNVRYYPRLMVRTGHPFSFEVAESADEVCLQLPVLFELHRARADAGGGVRHFDKFRFQDRQAFFRDVAPRLAEGGQLKIGVLRVRGEAVAAQLWLEMGETMFIYCSGYLPTWSRYSVGMIATQEALKHGIRRGLRRVELLRGVYQAKERWDTSTRTHAHLLLARQPRLVAGALALAPVRRRLHFSGVSRKPQIPAEVGR